jgi:hypothetical protein
MARRVNFDGIDDPKVTLLDALVKWTETYEITLWLNDRSFQLDSDSRQDDLRSQLVARTPIPAMRDASVEEVLRTILDRVPATRGAAFLYRSDHVEITTPRRALQVARRKIPSLLLEYMARMNEANWTDVDGYGMDGMQVLGEINYWNKVMIYNTKKMISATRER